MISKALTSLEKLKTLVKEKDLTSWGERDLLTFCEEDLPSLLDHLSVLLKDLQIYKLNDSNGCYSRRPSQDD